MPFPQARTSELSSFACALTSKHGLTCMHALCVQVSMVHHFRALCDVRGCGAMLTLLQPPAAALLCFDKVLSLNADGGVAFHGSPVEVSSPPCSDLTSC